MQDMPSSENKRKISMAGFPAWEKIKEKGDKRGFEGRGGATKLHVESSMNESTSNAGISATRTSSLSRIPNISASR